MFTHQFFDILVGNQVGLRASFGSGFGQAKIRANGQLLTPTRDARYEIGEFKEFPLPSGVIKDGKLLLTFDPLPEEAHINWRQQSRVSEVWLLKD